MRRKLSDSALAASFDKTYYNSYTTGNLSVKPSENAVFLYIRKFDYQICLFAAIYVYNYDIEFDNTVYLFRRYGYGHVY